MSCWHGNSWWSENGEFVRVFGWIFAGLAVLALIMYLIFPAQGQQAVKHLESSRYGLSRTVVLYANDGTIIRTWSGKFKITTDGGGVQFIDAAGNVVRISGTFVIEEKSDE